MEQSAKNLKDYLDMGRRHKRALFLIPTIVFAIGLLLARFLPATYSSSATILIEQQEIPMELVRSTVTSFAEQRIQSISQRVMTRRNLLQIMTDTGAYYERRKRETTEAVITRMRKNIALDMIRGPVASGRGGVMSGTIAFNISFEGNNPKITQDVTQKLTTLYLNENLQARNKTAQETLRFLTDEGERLSKRLGKLSGLLVNFKGKHRNTLPELHSLNLQTLTSTSDQLLNMDDNIRMFEEQIGLTEAELALTNPYRAPLGSQFSMGTPPSMETSPLDPAARLKDLRSRQKFMRANYSESHPDMVRLQRSIKSLEEELGTDDEGIDNAPALEELRQELTVARQKYAEGHPDIVRLTKTIETLESEEDLSKQPAQDPEEPAPAEEPFVSEHSEHVQDATNPVYLTLVRQLESAARNVRELKLRRERTAKKHDEAEMWLVAMPQIEREYSELQLNYSHTLQKYRELKAKQLSAEVGQSMEEDLKAERFTLIEPATFPEEPIKPNRPMIVILSFLLALGCGVGYVTFIEALDSSVRGPKGILHVLNVAPMAIIPYRTLDRQISKRRRRKFLLLFCLLAIVALAITLIHILVIPLDVLWFRYLREFGIFLGVDLAD